MHRRILLLALSGIICISIFNFGCTKIDTTTLGTDLIPEVDNINTFADTMAIKATQLDYNDTTFVSFADAHALGNISNDPLFGHTDADVYFQLKPDFFPYSFGTKDSLVGLDSVVLCMKYQYFYGDSTFPQQLQVSEITDQKFVDSPYINYYSYYQPQVGNIISDVKSVDVRTLGNYMRYRNGRDTVKDQIRIPLHQSFADQIWGSDSTDYTNATGNHRLHSDSFYTNAFRGFAVRAVGAGTANGLMFVSLSDTNTKLEVHYRIKGPLGRIDSVYKSFKLRMFIKDKSLLDTTNELSTTSNYIHRDRSFGAAGAPPSTEIYLQTQPGTMANLKIDSLTGYSNRIIHRAELIVEQVPDPAYDTLFPAPNFMYLDLKVPATSNPVRYKPIYFDLNPSVFYDPDKVNSTIYYPPSGPDFSNFGGYLRKRTGPAGQSINYYNINITRYVQQMVTKQSTNYEMRLFAPFALHYPQYAAEYTAYSNNVAFGRIRVGSGTHPVYPMRLRIVYSKLK